MRARWWVAAAGLSVVLVAAVVVALVASKGDGRRSVTDHGIRWTLDGPFVELTATEQIDAPTRARLRGRLVVSCERSGWLGEPDGRGKGLGLASARFGAIPQTVRVRLSSPVSGIDVCALRQPGIGDNISTAKFTPDPPLDDGMLVIK
jgi:hypothetical protein